MATVFHLPDIGEGLVEAEIVEWHAEVGDEVRADQALVSVETDKTQVELPAPVDGTLLHRGADAGTVLAVGSVLAVIGAPGESWNGDGAAEPAAATAGSAPMAAPVSATGGRAPALPLVRRMAEEAGVDLADVAGTGPGGRVLRADLEAHLAGRSAPAVGERPPLVGTLDETAEDLTATPPASGATVRLSPTRRAIAEHLARSWQEIPHVTTFGEFEATRLLAVRRALGDRLGIRVPLEALLIAAVTPVLGEHPSFNATLRGDELTLHGRADVGLAVDSGDGLLVAVVRDAGRRTLVGLCAEVDRLARAAKDRSLSREDSAGATFTLSNIGAVGGGYGTPLIPLGTTAILSVGRAEDAAVVRSGAVTVAKMAPLSLSYDHRVIDGATGRAFLARVKENLEEPALIWALSLEP